MILGCLGLAHRFEFTVGFLLWFSFDSCLFNPLGIEGYFYNNVGQKLTTLSYMLL